MNILDDDLYQLLPAYHRLRDAQTGYPLRALFRALASDGARIVDRDLDAFHDALFVETCAEAMLPRLGALVGVERLRPMPAAAGVSLRAFVGNVLRYRRAKGTAHALELLAHDVTSYSAKAVEFYARLAATQTVTAPRPDRHATALLRDPEVRAQQGGAFDRNARTPDVRSIARARGRYNLPNVGVFVWRLQCDPFLAPGGDLVTAEDLSSVPAALAWGAHPGHFTLAPGARGLPLFEPPRTAEDASPRESDAADRLRRVPLWRELEARRAALAQQRKPSTDWFGVSAPFTIFIRREGDATFRRVPPEEIMIGTLVPDPAVPVPPWARPPPTKAYPRDAVNSVALPVTVVIDPTTGRLVCATQPAGKEIVEVRVAYATGQPGDLGGGAYDRNDDTAPFGILADQVVYLVGPGAATPGTTRVASLAEALTKWGNEGARQKGLVVVTENAVDPADPLQPELVFSMPRDSDLTIVAAEWREAAAATGAEKGFIVRRSRRLLLLRPFHVTNPLAGDVSHAGRLTLDGIAAEAGIKVDRGSLRALEVRHCTLWPLAGNSLDLDGHGSAPLDVQLFRTVTGRVVAGTQVETLSIVDCVIARHAALPSVEALSSAVQLQRATVLGSLDAKSLEASDSLLMDAVDVERHQLGCVRYCYVGDPDSQLPRRYRCQPDLIVQAREQALGRTLGTLEARALGLSVRPVFVDREPEEPGYAMLSLACPPEIAFGGEDGTEMGAYGYAGSALRIANLTDLFVNYVPLGLEGGVIGADRASSAALRSEVR